jgi:glycosyltransferase involved in cell wall biosynthesis
MDLKKSKISIITPNYNYSKYIGKTIDSIINQNYNNIEYIIVDDGSTDNSVDIIRKYQLKFPHIIKLIEQENLGQTVAINNGLKKATGDIIGWINSDDTYCNNIFNAVLSLFEKNKEIDIVYGDVNIVDLNGKQIYRLRHFSFNYIESVFVGFANVLTSNAIFWKREILDQVGLLDESLKCNMDGDLFSKITFRRKLYYLKKPIANFRKQPYTKASIDNPNWHLLIKKEVNKVQSVSYFNLNISNYLPYRYVLPIKYMFQLNRFIKRILFMHYLIKYFEKLKYRFNK